MIALGLNYKYVCNVLVGLWVQNTPAHVTVIDKL